MIDGPGSWVFRLLARIDVCSLFLEAHWNTSKSAVGPIGDEENLDHSCAWINQAGDGQRDRVSSKAFIQVYPPVVY